MQIDRIPPQNETLPCPHIFSSDENPLERIFEEDEEVKKSSNVNYIDEEEFKWHDSPPSQKLNLKILKSIRLDEAKRRDEEIEKENTAN